MNKTKQRNRLALPYLHDMIKSMSQGEKTFYKYFIRHSRSAINLNIFNTLDRQKTYNDDRAFAALQRGGIITSKNVWRVRKQQTYTSILVAMRSYHGAEVIINKAIKAAILDVRYLYEKGLYESCRKELYKLKKIAQDHERYIDLIEILRLEILLLNATWSKKSLKLKAEAIDAEYKDYMGKITNYFKFMKEYLILQPTITPYSQIRTTSPDDIKEYKKSAKKPLFSKIAKAISFEARIVQHLIQSYYAEAIGRTEKNLDRKALFIKEKRFLAWSDSKENKNLLESSPTNHLAILSNMLRYSRHVSPEASQQTLSKIKALDFHSAKLISEKTFILYWYDFSSTYRTGKITQSLKRVGAAERFVQKNEAKLKIDDRLRIYFLLARLRFCNNQFRESEFWLQKIIDGYHKTNPRHDIYSVTHILRILCHYALEDIDSLKKSVASATLFLKRDKSFYAAERILIDFFKKSAGHKADQKVLIQALITKLETIPSRSDDGLLLQYFDFTLWFETWLKKESFENALQMKFVSGGKRFV